MSAEKAEKLFRSLTDIDDALIEEAAVRKRKRLHWERWCAAAACIALIVTGILHVLPDRKIRREEPAPFAGTETISAEGLLSMGTIGGSGSIRWEEYILDEGKPGLPQSPIKDSTDAAALPVYQTLYAKSSSDTYRLLLERAEALADTAKANLGIRLRWDTEEVRDNGEEYDDAQPVTGRYFYNMMVTLYSRNASVKLNAMSEGCVTTWSIQELDDLYAEWAAETVAVTDAMEDREIIETIQPVVSFVSDLTGEDYAPETANVRRWSSTKVGDRILVYMRASRVPESELKRLTGEFLAPELYIRLTDSDNDGTYELDGIGVQDGCYEYIGDYPLISLAEAEDHLHKGYAFGYGYCPACLLSDPEVDFSTYDLVQIEYYNSLSEFAIPYYVFYKYLGPAEYRNGSGTYERYAVGYVPAVEVDGLETLFAEREARHEIDKHTAWREGET